MIPDIVIHSKHCLSEAQYAHLRNCRSNLGLKGLILEQEMEAQFPLSFRDRAALALCANANFNSIHEPVAFAHRVFYIADAMEAERQSRGKP